MPLANVVLGGLVVADVAGESVGPRGEDTPVAVDRLVAMWRAVLIPETLIALDWLLPAADAPPFPGTGQALAILVVVAAVAFGAVLYRVTRLQERHQADGA